MQLLQGLFKGGPNYFDVQKGHIALSSKQGYIKTGRLKRSQFSILLLSCQNLRMCFSLLPTF